MTDYIEIPGLDGVGVVRHTGSSPTGARHMHQSLCLGAVLSGKRPLVVGKVRHTVLAGQVMALMPETPHACPSEGECEYVMINIPPACFEAAGFDFAEIAVLESVVDDPSFFNLVCTFADTALASASQLERQSALLSIMEYVCSGRKGTETDGLEPGRIALIRGVLEERCTEDIPLKTLARLAGCSPCRLNRTFASTVGMPPHQYHTMQRVRRVKQCIRAGFSLAESAVDAGFTDQSHMTRCFKKIMGMTPGKYAKGVFSASER